VRTLGAQGLKQKADGADHLLGHCMIRTGTHLPAGQRGTGRCHRRECTGRRHYEICRYGTLIAWAEELGHDEIVRFLQTNSNEEKAANTKRNSVALRKGVNAKASTQLDSFGPPGRATRPLGSARLARSRRQAKANKVGALRRAAGPSIKTPPLNPRVVPSGIG
jgi:hypothetical protein